MKERYEAEIEQILKDLDTPPPGGEAGSGQESEVPPDDLPSPFAPGLASSGAASSKRWVSPGKLAVVGIVVAVIGIAAAKLFVLAIAGLAIIGIAVAWTFLRRFAASGPPVWRGRPVDRPPATGWERVRRWWNDL